MSDGTSQDPSPPEAAPLSRDDAAASWRESARSLRALAWLKRFAKLWGFALFCIFVIYIFRDIVLPFVFAVLVAYILAPAVDRLVRVRVFGKRMSRGLAVISLYVVILSVLGGGLSFAIPRLSGDFSRLFREAPDMMAKVNREYLPRVGGWIDRHLGAGEAANETPTVDLPPPITDDTIVEPLPDGRYRVNLNSLAFELKPGVEAGEYLIAPYTKRKTIEPETGGKWERSIKHWVEDMVQGTQNETQRAFEYGKKFVTAVLGGLWKLILVLMLTAFILIDLERVRAFIRSLVPENYQSDYDRIATGIDLGLSGVIRGQFIIMLINGVLTYIGLVIFQVKYPLLLAAIASIMSLVPIFGSFMSTVPIVAVALVSRGGFDLTLGLYVAGWIAFIHLIESNLLNPKIMGGAARTHPVLVVFALIAGEQTWGVVGALFAVPVLSIVQTLFQYFRRKDGDSGVEVETG